MRNRGRVWDPVDPVRAALPPSALPGISPTRREIIRGEVSPLLKFENEATVEPLADLPPCGGDARQGRGG